MRRSTMLFSLPLSASALAIVVSACGSSDPPQQYPGQYQQYPQQYPQQGGYYAPPPQQQGFPQQPVPAQGPPPQQTFQPAPQAPPPAAPQPAPSTAPTETMATPGPLAPPCQNDSACGLHRCNTQFQKCAFPCAGPVDCAPGSQCLMGVCAPKAPGT